MGRTEINLPRSHIVELRTVNPRKLKFHPNNPRRTKAMPEHDAQLAANILVHGLIQPPLVRQEGEDLVIVAGEPDYISDD